MATPAIDRTTAPARSGTSSVLVRAYRGLSLGHVWLAAALVAPFLFLASTPIGISDVWSSMAAGRWIMEHGQIFTVDPFTAAPPAENQIHQQWLGYLLYYALYELGGLEAIVVSNAVAATAAFALVAAAALTLTRSLRASSAAVLYAFVLALSNLTPRNQTLAYVIFGVYLLVLARVQRGGRMRALALLPPAMVLWANLHGSFFLGFVLLGAAGLDVALRTRSPRAVLPYAATLAATILAACVTPYGPGSLLYLARMSTNPILSGIVAEWAPTSIDLSEGKLFFASAALLVIVGLQARVRLSVSAWLLVAFFAWLALSAVRSVAWWGLATAPLFARLLVGVFPERSETDRTRREVPVFNAALLALVVGLAIGSLPGVKDLIPGIPANKRGLVADEGRHAATEFLRDRTYPGVMFNNHTWGGYFDWVLWPQHKPFLDGRIELHPPEVWEDYVSIIRARATWKRLADRYDVGYFVLTPRIQPLLIQELREDPDWRLEFEADDAVIFVRATP